MKEFQKEASTEVYAEAVEVGSSVEPHASTVLRHDNFLGELSDLLTLGAGRYF